MVASAKLRTPFTPAPYILHLEGSVPKRGFRHYDLANGKWEHPGSV